MRKVWFSVALLACLGRPSPGRAQEAEAAAQSGVSGQVRTGAWFARLDRLFNQFGDRRELELIIDDRDIGTGKGLLLDFGFDLQVLGSRIQFDYFTDQVVNTAEERIVGGNKLAQQAFRMLVGKIEPRTAVAGATLVIGARQVDLKGPIARPEQFGAFDDRSIAGMPNVQWSTKYTSVDAALLWRTKSQGGEGHYELGPMVRYTHFSLPSAMLSIGEITAANIDIQRFLVTGTQDMVDVMLAAGLYTKRDNYFLDLSGEVGLGYLRMSWPRWGTASGFSFPISTIMRGGLVLPAGPISVRPYAGVRMQTWMPLLQDIPGTRGTDASDNYLEVDPPAATANWVLVWGPELGLEVRL
jgi:hypothetical protein